MTDTTTRPTPTRDEPPAPVAASTGAPATLTVANNLSEDAILATEMLIAPTANAQALFANPFANDREEMLFIDLAGNLLWLTHDGDAGWTMDPLMEGEGKTATANEVVIVVHVDGTVWAIAADDRGITKWRLIQTGTKVTWVGGEKSSFKDARALQVQYLPERPARPVVFFRHDHAGLLHLQAQVAMEAPGDKDPWFAYDVLRGLDPKLLRDESSAYYGLDSVKGTARVYTIDDKGTLWSMHGDRNSITNKSIGAADEVAGIWHSPSGVGCIALRAHNPMRHPEIHTITTVWPEADRFRSADAYVDARLLEAALWEDGSGRYHLYGLTDGELRVVHQSGLHFFNGETPVPAWDSRLVTVNDQDVRVAVSRPLTGSVDMYALDGFPDEYPSQHVMHVAGSVPDGEKCVIMSQDVTTTWWSREVIRCPARKKPYKMKMHESRLTLMSQAGAPVADCPVTLTADRAVDFRIGGAFYRCGPEHPVTARTDTSGTIRVATVARDLIGCTIHVTAVGLPDGTSFNPVTDLHNFLGGTGTLSMHQQGISEDALKDAKTADGRWVFPAWHEETTLAVVPQPADVLRWCRHAYQARTEPQVFVTSQDGGRVALRGIVVQTWDPSRPAYEEVTTAERQDELATARAVRADEWDPGSIGDVFLAIGQGLVSVVETGVDFAEGVASIVIEWVEGKLLHLKLLWDQSENPFQFIQAVFNELKGEVEDVLDWLSWVFDWDDIMATADALREGVDQLPLWLSPQIDYVRDKVVDGWFADKKEEIHGFFAQVKVVLAGQTFGDKPKAIPSRVPLAGAKNPATSVVDPQKGLGPKSNWMFDWLHEHADGDFLPPASEASDPPQFREAILALEDLLTVFEDDKVGQDFSKAIDDLGSLVANLFDASDLQSLARTEIVSFLDLLEDLIDLVLDLADVIVHRALTLIEKVIACVPAVLEMDLLQDSFIGWLWEFVCEAAGIEYQPPTVGDVFITCLAFLFTTVSKAVLGTVPFPDGFPDMVGALNGQAPVGDAGQWFPDDDFRGPEHYPIPILDQVRVQAMVGVFQMAFTGVDLYMDSKHVAGSDDPPATDAERLFIGGIVTFDLIAFGVLDTPVFWGCQDLKKDGSAENWMWWGEWFCKAIIYAGDFAVACLHKPAENHQRFSAILGTMQGNFGNLMITILGWIELGMSIALCVLGNENSSDTTMAWIWMGSQFLSMLSSITAFLRYGGMHPEVRYTKQVLDVFGDMSAGFWYMVMGALTADRIPKARAVEWKTEVRAGVPFTGVLECYDTHEWEERGEIIFGAPGWRFDDESKVPPGLGFDVYSPDPRWNRVKVVGTVPASAAQDDPYVFDVRVGNGYDPTISSTVTLTLKVTA